MADDNTEDGPIPTLYLSERDWAVFTAENTDLPSPEFIKALQDYRKAIADGTLTTKE